MNLKLKIVLFFLMCLLLLSCILPHALASKTYTLGWDDKENVEGDILYYIVYWGERPRDYNLGQSEQLSQKEYFLTLEDGLYFFSVRAFNVLMGSEFSKELVIGKILGDVDNNRTVNLRDAVLAIQVAVGMETKDVNNAAGDTTGEEEINLSEAAYILKTLSK